MKKEKARDYLDREYTRILPDREDLDKLLPDQRKECIRLIKIHRNYADAPNPKARIEWNQKFIDHIYQLAKRGGLK